jgi:hypothetical protein
MERAKVGVPRGSLANVIMAQPPSVNRLITSYPVWHSRLLHAGIHHGCGSESRFRISGLSYVWARALGPPGQLAITLVPIKTRAGEIVRSRWFDEAARGMTSGAGGLLSTVRPDLSGFVALATNRESLFSGKEIVSKQDYDMPGKILPSKALEKQIAANH